MKKIQIIMALALCAALTANAAITPWSEDFEGLSALPAGMSLGGQQNTGTAGTTTVGGGTVNWSETNYRQFVGCTDQNYRNEDFTAYATVTVQGTTAFDSIYFGITEDYDCVDWKPEGNSAPYLSLDPRPAGGTASGVSAMVNGIVADTLVAAGTVQAGTHRLRLDFEAVATNLTVSIDVDYAGGAFTADYTGSTTSGGLTTGTAYLFFGGGSGAKFDNIEVVPEPATLGLIATFGGGLLLRRKMRG